ncbi:uncharacterized protein Bfra_006290ia [Botrytis fragariae]|uniref:Uncharacterized protein n=1 Tax=Botrytis fragariae TaxID=1964551 RepID=A0A8H6B445_9HELO|nr:uncharacterized protein Bfra_006290ia [Botrytis fragariae]KAF5879086.1 hypothetical protein Bfra_006290ia [Botrytis fragariae]
MSGARFECLFVSSKQGIPSPGSGFEDRYSLHLTFYEIVTILAQKIETITWSFWNNGVLHTESNGIPSSPTSVLVTKSYWRARITPGDRGKFLCISVAYAYPSISDSKYWTLLEMNPATIAYTSHSSQDLKSVSGNMLLCLFSHAYPTISETVICWKKILKYFDQPIGDKLQFLYPDYCDKFLSNEEVLSRSKKYSWAISTPKDLRKSVLQNTLQVRQLLEQETSETTTEEELGDFEEHVPCYVANFKM